MYSLAKVPAAFLATVILVSGCSREAEQAVSPEADALSATFGSHGGGARIVDWDGNVLQEGNNGFTCMPSPPAFVERGAVSPMCLDKVWMAWADAWQNRQPFSTDRIGIAYMLAGDSGASNVDPYAEGPTEDNEWIVEGPHLMIIAPDSSLLDDIPTDPSSGGPYVMWRGSEYEHVMVPVKIPDVTAVESPLDDALSAADTALQASVAAMDWAGEVLQESEGNYTCMPTPPQFTTGRAPMCFDQTWMAWGNAWQNRQPFSTDRIGIAYMLAGDEGASNIDPFAEGATDDNQWVVEGPHMMMIAPDISMLAGVSRNPRQSGPYVMWDGTPYAHVMIPVAERE